MTILRIIQTSILTFFVQRSWLVIAIAITTIFLRVMERLSESRSIHSDVEEMYCLLDKYI